MNGASYSPGVRPGRVDEVVALRRPDAAERSEIIDLVVHHSGPELTAIVDEVAAMTEGLSGAYLAEVARDSGARHRWCGRRRPRVAVAAGVEQVESGPSHPP